MLITLAVAISCISVACAQTYEETLKGAATNLVSKLEAANQHSGTVIDFTDLQGASNELGRFLAQELSDQLVSAGKTISFVDRANLQTLLRENKLSMEGFVSPESAKKLGNLIGIDTVIFGTTTPLGERIRLSLRAVSVETGRIVATQSVTLLAAGGLGDMYTHGVAATSPGSGPSQAAQPADVRTRFRGDSLRLSGKEVVLSKATNCGGADYENCATATVVLENLSGVGFDGSIVKGSTSIGSCNLRQGTISGLGSSGRYIPVGGKVTLTISGWPCDIDSAAVKSVDVTTSMAIKIGEQVFDMPISTSNVPVRAAKSDHHGYEFIDGTYQWR
nr:FlgO family outer membrane protein [uncultured Rhodopila sp.]